MNNTNLFDYLNIFLAAKKDDLREELARRFRQSYSSLLEAEVEARRMKTRNIILNMAKLKNALYDFETTYAIVKKECGNIDRVDSYVMDLKKEIKRLSDLKNKPLSI